MNEFIFNGKSSKDYGLIVNTLPPIVKPPIRTEKIEIDGRNGDIINNLGYMAYDKEITITRIDGNIDINSIIKWLNYSELGTLVLSNEPSLYYKAQIVEQIDFTRLENFEPVKIKFHVQPFKYKYPIEKATLPRGEASGANVQIENGKITKFIIEGKSTQETRSGKNLCPMEAFDSMPSNGTVHTYDASTHTITMVSDVEGNTGRYLFYNWGLNVGSKYTLSFDIRGTAGKKARVGWNKKPIDITLTATYTRYSITIDASSANEAVTFYSLATSAGGLASGEYMQFADVLIEPGEKDTGFEEFGASPSPEFPSEIKSVTGPVVIKTEGKNYLNVPSEYKVNGTIFDVPLSLKAGTYILSAEDIVSNSGNWSNSAVIFYSNDGKQYYFELGGQYLKTRKITFDKDIVKYNIYSGNDWSSSQGVTTTFTNLMISKNGGEYEPHKECITVSIPLTEPLRSLSNVIADKIYAKVSKIKKELNLGLVVLNGTQVSYIDTAGEDFTTIAIATGIAGQFKSAIYLSNYFAYGSTGNNRLVLNLNSRIIYLKLDNAVSGVVASDTNEQRLEKIKTWLCNNNVEVIYELAEPIVTEITDEVEMLQLLDGENNISNSADANMIIDYVDNKLRINNEGNHFSKPIFTITGSGIIEFIVNGNKLFSYTFPEGEDTVVIDSQKQDAYLGTVLKNRNMSGEFPTLEIGENIITWNGNITNVEILSQSRWL